MNARGASVGPRILRLAFWGYAAILFTMTHWPKLQLPGPRNTDKFVHVAAFGIWTTLLIGAGLFGSALTWRNLAWCLLIAPVYAAIDESSQAIPFIHRSAEFADYYANLGGIALAGVVASAAMILRAKVKDLSESSPNHE